MDTEKKSPAFTFVTGSARVPINDLELFVVTLLLIVDSSFTIHVISSMSNMSLPKAHTWYEDKETGSWEQLGVMKREGVRERERERGSEGQREIEKESFNYDLAKLQMQNTRNKKRYRKRVYVGSKSSIIYIVSVDSYKMSKVNVDDSIVAEPCSFINIFIIAT